MMDRKLPREAPLLLDAVRAAEALAISPRKLWELTKSGAVPHIRVGRCLRYPVDELRRWIEEQMHGGEE